MNFTRGFPVEEFDTRLANAQRHMRQADMDALLFMTEREFTYFAGFQSNFWQSPTRPWFLVLPAEGKPIAVIPSIGENALKISWIDDVRLWASPNPDDEGISLLASILKNLSKRHGRVGVPMGPETHLRMPANDVVALKTALGSVALVDSTEIIRNLRMVKSEHEIAKHRYICDLVSDAYENFGDVAQAGMSEREILAAHRLDLLQRGADTVPYIVATAAQDGTDDAIRFPNDRPLVTGDVLFVDTGAEIDGYYCDFDRNFAIGYASDETKRAYELAYRATDAGIAAVRPGVRACDVWQAMADVLASGGATGGGVGRMGHGIGLHNTEWPSLMASDQTVLQEGMILAIEPGYDFAPGKMMLHEENVVVRENGAELLTRRAPTEILIL
ncbi:MAG: M24 family metallopeptidase [Cognatishimia sp.]|uniref:M24 family metallopeptidase n=1 Tax=Cognatishimia sp. TaxID=2211648 RepID=UPI0040594860